MVNQAVETIRLVAGDIRSLNKDEQIKVILLDRNIGCHTAGMQKHKIYKPIDYGCTYGTYTHKSGLTVILHLDDVGVTLDPFIWEVNGPSVGDDTLFWRPIVFDENVRCSCNNNNESLTENDIRDDVPVGWRGPAVLRDKAIEYLPSTVKHYGGDYNDYAPYRYYNLLTFQ